MTLLTSIDTRSIAITGFEGMRSTIMMTFGIALILISVPAILYFGRARTPTPPKLKLKQNAVTRSREKSQFHAVSIVCGDQACDAVRGYAGIKYLSGEAPKLPIAGCNTPNCACHYEHHKGRRETNRRKLFGTNRNPYGAMDRRSFDRRESWKAP